MSSSASLTTGVAGRYATALFEIARENRSLPKLEADLQSLQAVVNESSELREMISSPILSRKEQSGAITAIAEKMELGPEITRGMGLMAEKRRLFVLPALIEQLLGLIADDRGEVSAEVSSAAPLTDSQVAALASALKSSVGSDIKLNVNVDESLIGGLVVKVGSRMVDTSIRSKLANLQNSMKEVG